MQALTPFFHTFLLFDCLQKLEEALTDSTDALDRVQFIAAPSRPVLSDDDGDAAVAESSDSELDDADHDADGSKPQEVRGSGQSAVVCSLSLLLIPCSYVESNHGVFLQPDYDAVVEETAPVRQGWVKAAQLAAVRYGIVDRVLAQNRSNAAAAESFFSRLVDDSMLKQEGGHTVGDVLLFVCRVFCICRFIQKLRSNIC